MKEIRLACMRMAIMPPAKWLVRAGTKNVKTLIMVWVRLVTGCMPAAPVILVMVILIPKTMFPTVMLWTESHAILARA